MTLASSTKQSEDGQPLKSLARRQRPRYRSLSPLAKAGHLRTLPLPFPSDQVASPVADPSSNESQPTPAGPSAAKPTVPLSPPLTSSFTAPPNASSLATQPTQPAQSLAARQLVAQLAREVKSIEVAGRLVPESESTIQSESAPAISPLEIFSTGCASLDECLPGGGYEAGSVIEYLQAGQASGATTLAWTVARQALAQSDRYCVVVDWCQQFYPPAAAALGIDLKRVVIVRPVSLADRLWALDQALRSPAVVAVVAQIEHLDDRAARRLQLSAQRGGGLGLLIRSWRQRQHPSWAEVQWRVRPYQVNSCPANSSGPHRQWELELVRARGGRLGRRTRIQVNALTGRVEPVTAATTALARSLARQASSSAISSDGHQLGWSKQRVS